MFSSKANKHQSINQSIRTHN